MDSQSIIDNAEEFLRFGSADEKSRKVIEALIENNLELSEDLDKSESRLNNLQESLDEAEEYLRPLPELIKTVYNMNTPVLVKKKAIIDYFMGLDFAAEQYMKNLVDEIGV